MKIYYININPKPDGGYEVHVESCQYLAGFINRAFLGNFHDPESAVDEALKTWPRSKPCKYCIGQNHQKTS